MVRMHVHMMACEILQDSWQLFIFMRTVFREVPFPDFTCLGSRESMD